MVIIFRFFNLGSVMSVLGLALPEAKRVSCRARSKCRYQRHGRWMEYGWRGFLPTERSNDIMTKYPSTTFPVAKLRYQSQHKPQYQTIIVFPMAEYACGHLPLPICSPHPGSSGYHITISYHSLHNDRKRRLLVKIVI